MTVPADERTVEQIARDVYPAEVLFPDGSILTRARVFVTTERMLIYTSDNQRRVSLIAHIELAEPGSIARDRSTLQGRLEVIGQRVSVSDDEYCADVGAQTWWVNRGRGCSCKTPELTALSPPMDWVR